jgi:hypothetical protein
VVYNINDNINVKMIHLTKFIELVEFFSRTIPLYIRLFYKDLVTIEYNELVIKLIFNKSITQKEYDELVNKLNEITPRLEKLRNFFYNLITRNIVEYIEILDYESIKIVFKDLTTYTLDINNIDNFREGCRSEKSVLLLNKKNPNNTKIIKIIDKLSELFDYHFLIIDDILLIYNDKLDILRTITSVDKIGIDDIVKQLTFKKFNLEELNNYGKLRAL